MKKIKQIIKKSLPLYERLKFYNEGLRFSKAGDFPLKQHWLSVLGNDIKTYRKRLDLDNLTPHHLDYLSEFDRLNFPLPTFEWEYVLKRSVKKSRNDYENYFILIDSNIPFGEFFFPFLDVFCDTLLLKIERKLLGEAVVIKILEGLCIRLSEVASQTLFFEFELFKHNATDNNGNNLYGCFIEFIKDNILNLFSEYPVLARLLSTTTHYYIQFIDEFHQRLQSDFNELKSVFGVTDKIVNLEISLSDKHDKGKSVIKLTYANSVNLIYKPRELKIEKNFNDFLGKLNVDLKEQHFKTVEHIVKDNYGWVEYITKCPITKESEVSKYYKIAGELSLLVLVLEGTDFHSENIIACCEKPVPIDLEMILSHRFYSEKSIFQQDDFKYLDFSNSLIRTGLIPFWRLDRDGDLYDISGFGNRGNIPYYKLIWGNVNTDKMVYDIKRFVIKDPNSLPTYHNKNEFLSDHLQSFLTGFEFMYRHLMSNKSVIKSYVQDNFSDLKIRYANRYTKTYDTLIKKLYHPKYLRDGLHRSIQIDVLSNSYLAEKALRKLVPLLRLEHEEVEQLDIPKAYAKSQSCTLLINNNEIPKSFARSSLTNALKIIGKLNEADLFYQKEIISKSVLAQVIEAPQTTFIANKINDIKIELYQNNLEGLAIEIGDLILRNSRIEPTHKKLFWFDFDFSLKNGRSSFGPMDYPLYSGTSGVGLFLAALSRSENKFEQFASKTFLPMIQSIHSYKVEKFIRKGGDFAGINGFSSLLYTFCVANDINENLNLKKSAKQLFDQITKEIISLIPTCDLVNGISGTLLFIIKYYESTKDPEALLIAMFCGDEIIKRATIHDNGTVSWSYQNLHLSGLSHGVSGITLSLLRLYNISGDPKYYRVSMDALNYENSLYDPIANNWLDLRYSNTNKKVFYNTWCHGATGIGLSRIAMNKIVNDDLINTDIHKVFQSVKDAAISEVDHLCCGNIGSLEFLIQHLNHSQDNDTLKTLREKRSAMLNRASNQNGFLLFPYNKQLNFGFFRGLSGIGFTLLRTINSDLPCISVLE